MVSLHIATISYDWYPFEPRALRQAEAAARGGHQVDVICLHRPHEKQYEVYHNVRIYRVPLSRGFGKSLPHTILLWCWFLFLAAIKLTLLHLKNHYDVVHVHNMPDFLVFAALIPRLLGAKIILDVQDVSPELMTAKVQGKGLLRRIVIWLALWQERISSTFAHHIVTTGEPFTKLLVKHGVPEKKISSILNSADSQLFPAERRCPLPYDTSSMPLESRPFKFMYHGLLAKRNGLDIAIHALEIARRSVPQLQLVIHGSGDQVPFLKQLAITLGISDSVIFTAAPVAPDKIVDFVVQGDVGIIPYRNDGFEDYVLPTKAYEYAWMQRPIIASNTYAIRTMFRPQSVYLCDSTKPESFAQAMIDLYEHAEKRATLVANAAEDYVPYRWENNAKRYLQLLADLTREQVEQCEQVLPTSENTDDTTKLSKKEGKPRILLVISVQQPTATIRAEIAAGRHPRRDYDALQQVLDADVLYLDDALTSRSGRLVKRILGARIALIWAAFCHRHRYDILYTDTELIGLPLAMLLKLSGTDPKRLRHVTLAHYLSPFEKRIFFRLGVGSHINTMIVHSSAQRFVATKVLHMPDERIECLPYQVDVHFWRSDALSCRDDDIEEPAEQRPIICVPGLEQRDYPTLFSAVRDLDVIVYISTRFMTQQHTAFVKLADLPKNISCKQYDYETLRKLYAAARFIVVPLLEVDFQAGITVILEAMAMGKAVIVSGIRGQTDVVRDPRNEGRGPIAREWFPGFLDNPDVAEILGRLSTGFYVTPGNPDELRQTIQYLLNHPEIADELGRNGSRVAEEYFSLEAFAERFATAILGDTQPAAVATSQTIP